MKRISVFCVDHFHCYSKSSVIFPEHSIFFSREKTKQSSILLRNHFNPGRHVPRPSFPSSHVLSPFACLFYEENWPSKIAPTKRPRMEKARKRSRRGSLSATEKPRFRLMSVYVGKHFVGDLLSADSAHPLSLCDTTPVSSEAYANTEKSLSTQVSDKILKTSPQRYGRLLEYRKCDACLLEYHSQCFLLKIKV